MTPPVTTCPSCKGTGRVTRLMAGPCPRCGVRHLRPQPCPDCGGRGRLAQPTCNFCFGTGERTVRDPSSGELMTVKCQRCEGRSK